MSYTANENRYSNMKYNRCGRSGMLLPAISFGLWHNFGYDDDYENSRKLILKAFDSGITHYDLANNYGPPPGAAEEVFGRIISTELKRYRDELVISTKAGYGMWNGPYGDGGSRKYLISSLDQSLKRLKVDYVDIFYHHRPDPNTPMEETFGALDHLVKSGKALYAGISNYPLEQAKEAISILKKLGTPCLIHQPSYNMFDRWIENGLLDLLEEEGVGSIVFVPLAQGLLTGKYLNGIPSDSRAAGGSQFLNPGDITPEKLDKISKLNELARERGQSLPQMALAWVLRKGRVTSALIGASKPEQIEENLKALNKLEFTGEELNRIDKILMKG